MGFSRQENRLVQKDMQQTVQFLIKSWKEPKVHEHITDYINYIWLYQKLMQGKTV